MKKIGAIIREERIQLGLSQEAFGKRIGVSKQTVSNYENDFRRPPYETLEAICDVLNKPMDFFTTKAERDEALRKEYSGYTLPKDLRYIQETNKHKVRLISPVAAGKPILAEENWEYVDSPFEADYALTIEGDSMEPEFMNGDIVYIRAQEDVNDGRIAVVLVEDSTTLKRVYHIPGGLQLISLNPKYAPMVFLGNRSEPMRVRIIGVPVGHARKCSF